MRRTEIAQVGDPSLVEQLTDTLRQRSHFSGVDPAQFGSFLRLGALAEIDTGETLIREGEPSSAEIYLLVEGSLAVQAKTGFIARLDRPGDVIGEVAVLLSSKRTADVVAESAVRLVVIPSEVVSQPEFTDIEAGIRSVMLRDDWVKY